MEPFVACAVARLSSIYAPYLSADEFARRIRAEYRQMWSDRTDPAQCEHLCRRLGIPGKTPEQFAARIIDLGPLGSVIASIHFRDLDPSRPFVGVLATTRDIRSADELGALCERLVREFAAFEPARIWMFCPGDEATWCSMNGVRSDQRLLVGHVPSLRALPPPPGLNRITLERPTPGMYQRYLDSYQQLFAVNPALEQHLPIQDRESVTSSPACFEAWIDGTWAGLIAACPGDILGLRGHYILDQLLHARFRGQGLAPALQRQLIERLDPRGDDVLWGYIDAINTPSRRTAARSGRDDVGGFVFIDSATTTSTW